MMHDSTNHITSRKPTLELALAKWIRLVAAPLFAVFAVLSLLSSSVGILCTSSSATLALHDMGLMYLLMALVHLPPWLMLIGNGLERENANNRDGP